ncbi:hypothetical protein TorRG33x02_258880 [Trema orientale]|uniref:Uncharacterized protein n=1 Tax=Trema orientale TaxID=63057 RepID=A0A2P5D8R2_TREOI|nr:hypothetical protein TorRG33x02_258880 [Trema orientale]
MVAIVLKLAEEDEVSELRMETKRTTMNMHIETGVMILISSSPKVSRMVEGLWFWAIGCSRTGSNLVLGGVLVDGSFRFGWLGSLGIFSEARIERFGGLGSLTGGCLVLSNEV